MALRYRLLSITLFALLLSSAGYVGYVSGERGSYGAADEGFVWPGPSYGFDGQFISFSFDPDAWALKDVSVKDVVIIERMWLPREMPTYMEKGAFFTLHTSEYSLNVTDFSSPVISYKAHGDTTLKIELDSEVVIKNGNAGLLLSKGNVSADVIFSGSIDIHKNILNIGMKDGDVLRIRFSVSSVSGSNDLENALQDALSLKKLGAECYVKDGDFSFVSYDNVSMNLMEREKKKMVFSVDSSESSGKTISLHISGNFTNLSVLLDGLPVEKGSYYDALFSTGNKAIWNCTVAENDITVLVYVPHFSTHTLTIEETSPHPYLVSSPHVSMMPVIGALLVSIIAAVVLIWRRKRS